MYITIDGQSADISAEDKNIVDVAERAGIGIPAPCYKNGRKGGCCQVCVVEIDGKQEYACCTKPTEGMNVIVNREDLIALRKERARNYSQNKHQQTECSCGCSCGTSSGESCC